MSNALDERLQENVWETRIPLKIKISPKDLITSVPLTLYYSLPRISYLSSIFGDIIKNFEGFIQVQLSDFWIECEGVPLKWQYPFGVLVDNLGIDASSGPLTLTVHIKDFPSEKVVQYTSLDSIRFYFINSIKEADLIRYPISKKVFNLKKDETERLVQIISKERNITEYRKLINFEEKIVKYPDKLVFCRTDLVITKSVEAKKADNENYKMEQFLKDSLGDLIYNKLKDICKIIIHGMEVEENVSFIYYYYNFCYMDTFLYISFVDKAIQENK